MSTRSVVDAPVLLGPIWVALALLVTLAAGSSAAACPPPDTLAVVGGVELSDLDDLIELPVAGADGQPVGTVQDVILDDCRAPAMLVVAVPGKEVAVPIDRVRFEPDGEGLRLEGLTRDAVAALPAADRTAVSLRRR